MKHHIPYYSYRSIQSLGLIPLVLYALLFSCTPYPTFVISISIISIITCITQMARWRQGKMIHIMSLTLAYSMLGAVVIIASCNLKSNFLLLNVAIALWLPQLFINTFFTPFMIRYVEKKNQFKISTKLITNCYVEFSTVGIKVMAFLGFTFVFCILHNTNLIRLSINQFNFFVIFSFVHIGGHELIRIWLLNREFKRAVWLPIISPEGNAIGQVEQQLSFQLKSFYLHPHLRIIVIHKGRILLISGTQEQSPSQGNTDTPLSADMLYGESCEESCERIIQKWLPSANLKPNFLTKYHFSTSSMQRLIYLYWIDIKDSDCKVLSNFKESDWWQLEEIEANSGKKMLSDCFEDEFPLFLITIKHFFEQNKEPK